MDRLGRQRRGLARVAGEAGPALMTDTSYRDKLRSLSFKTRPAPPKVVMEGDHREGVKTTLSDEKQDVQVFVPPVDVVMDRPQFQELRTEASDIVADAKRKDTSSD